MTEIIEVDFAPKKAGEPEDLAVRVKRREHNDCAHARTFVYSRERKIVCQACGAQLDPIQVILELAQKWEETIQPVVNARRELSWLQTEIQKLKDERNRLRSQLRYHNKKHPEDPSPLVQKPPWRR